MNAGASEYRRAKRRKVDESIDVLDTMTGIVVGHLSDKIGDRFHGRTHDNQVRLGNPFGQIR